MHTGTIKSRRQNTSNRYAQKQSLIHAPSLRAACHFVLCAYSPPSGELLLHSARLQSELCALDYVASLNESNAVAPLSLIA